MAEDGDKTNGGELHNTIAGSSEDHLVVVYSAVAGVLAFSALMTITFVTIWLRRLVKRYDRRSTCTKIFQLLSFYFSDIECPWPKSYSKDRSPIIRISFFDLPSEKPKFGIFT